MSFRKEEVYDYYFKRNNHLIKENISQILFYKLIYFYIIESKRLLAVNLFGIYLHCSKDHLNCTNKMYPYQQDDLTSWTGRSVRLYTGRSGFLDGIKGKFKSIWPGTYEIKCHIKFDENEKCLTHYNEHYNQVPESKKNIHCYFYALADHGLDCKCHEIKVNFDCFNATMGKIKVFELSDIYFGFKIPYHHNNGDILFDYVQLNIVE